MAYQDKYQLKSRPTDQVSDNSLGKECQLEEMNVSLKSFT